MKLGSFTLNKGVIWVNESTAPSSSQQITRTILNSVIVYNVPIEKREIILEARDGSTARGFFTREVFEFLKQSEKFGTVFNMEYRNILSPVIVKSGGVRLTPKRETEEIDINDYYTGTVILQEV